MKTEHRFKIGDKVTVSNPNKDTRDAVPYYDELDQMVGRRLTGYVAGVYDWDHKPVDVMFDDLNYSWWFDADELSLVDEKPKKRVRLKSITRNEETVSYNQGLKNLQSLKMGAL